MGIWTKDIRSSTGLPTLTLSKVYKSLESKVSEENGKRREKGEWVLYRLQCDFPFHQLLQITGRRAIRRLLLVEQPPLLLAVMVVIAPEFLAVPFFSFKFCSL